MQRTAVKTLGVLQVEEWKSQGGQPPKEAAGESLWVQYLWQYLD